MTEPTASACLSCEGRCCMAYIVPVTGADVWRIAQAQHLPPALFVQREPEDAASDTGFLLRPGGTPYGLALQAQRAAHNARVCGFLMHLRDGVKRCGIYPHRPMACRTYPVQLAHDCLTTRDDKLCPPGSWHGIDRDDAQWRTLVQHQTWEWEIYARVVDAWNSSMRAQPADSGCVLGQYLDYLLLAYDHLVPMFSDCAQPPATTLQTHELTALAHATMTLA